MTQDADPTALRAVLLALAAGALSVGIPATVAPHAFYVHYPFFAHWVDRLPPYNQHLTMDVGELELAFGVLFLWAGWRPHRRLVVPVCLVWTLSQAVHAGYHLAHLRPFSVADAVGQTTGFAVLLVLSLVAVALCRRQPEFG
jgi:hypothetical protein